MVNLFAAAKKGDFADPLTYTTQGSGGINTPHGGETTSADIVRREHKNARLAIKAGFPTLREYVSHYKTNNNICKIKTKMRPLV